MYVFRPFCQSVNERSSCMIFETTGAKMHVMKREWIEKRLKALGKKKIELARQLGLPHTRVTEIIKGTRSILSKEIPGTAMLLEMSEADLLRSLDNNKFLSSDETELREEPLPNEVGPLIGNVQAGAFIEAFEEAPIALYPIVGRARGRHGVFCLRVLGDSMNQFYPEGTIIFCQRLIDGPELRDGKHVIVKRRAAGDLFEATVKEYTSKGKKTILTPLSSNKKHEAIEIENNGEHHHDAGVPDVEIWAVVLSAVVEAP